MVGDNFPITDYYRGHILDATTISRVGGWWVAILLIEDPKSKKPFISLYRWQSTDRGWKARKQFKFNSQKEVGKIFDGIKEMVKRLPE
tara:strand:+ start:4448 stop:4711 length:264 start_codon:yes stop_codon:yes gene_type:complete